MAREGPTWRFRQPLPTAALPLPRELRGHIGTFLGYGVRGDLRLGLSIIRYGSLPRRKRCTPCRHCEQTRTYNVLCAACDAYLWANCDSAVRGCC